MKICRMIFVLLMMSANLLLAAPRCSVVFGHFDLRGGPLTLQPATSTLLPDGVPVQVLEADPISGDLQTVVEFSSNGETEFGRSGFFLTRTVQFKAAGEEHYLRVRVWNHPELDQASGYWESPTFRISEGSQQVSFRSDEWTYHPADSHPMSAGENADGTVKAYALQAAYPNPFNASTTIVYDLADPTRVTIDVFDGLGRRAASLMDAHQSAGTHRVSFNSTTLASGMYVIRMITESGFSDSRRIILLK